MLCSIGPHNLGTQTGHKAKPILLRKPAWPKPVKRGFFTTAGHSMGGKMVSEGQARVADWEPLHNLARISNQRACHHIDEVSNCIAMLSSELNPLSSQAETLSKLHRIYARALESSVARGVFRSINIQCLSIGLFSLVKQEIQMVIHKSSVSTPIWSWSS